MAQEEKQTEVLKIGTFNIALGGTKYTNDGKKDYREYDDRTVHSNLYDISKLICKNNIDLIGLQEVDYLTNRVVGKQIDDTSEIVETSQKYFNKAYLGQFKKAMDYKQGEYGNSIIFKPHNLQLMKLKHYIYSHKLKELRSAVSIKFKYKQHQLWFVTTHLSYNADSAMKQLKELLTKFINDYKFPTIVCGDFNICFGSTQYEEVKSLWTEHGFVDIGPFNVQKQEHMFTNPRKRKQKIDYILIRNMDKKGKINVQNIEIIQPKNKDNEWFSDHWALVADISVANV